MERWRGRRTSLGLDASLKYIAAVVRHMGMTPTHPPVGPYAIGYAKGRHAAKEYVPASHNPFPDGSAAFHGWDDGHFDEQSARNIAIQRHSALVWSSESNYAD
jgi:hypothetical protein